MTEQMIPAGGTAVAEQPLPDLPMDAADVADNGGRRKLMILGAGLGVVIIALVAFFLTKGGSTPVATGAVPQHHVVAAAPVKKAHHHAKGTAKPVVLPKKYTGHVGRDPFNPLYTAPVAAAATSGSTGGSTTTSGGGTPTTTTTGTTTTTTHKAVYRPIWISLRAVSRNSATFAIGYSNHHNLRVFRFVVNGPRSQAGTLFAKTFDLLGISGQRVTVKYGDGTPFVLDLQHNTMIVN